MQVIKMSLTLAQITEKVREIDPNVFYFMTKDETEFMYMANPKLIPKIKEFFDKEKIEYIAGSESIKIKIKKL